jgi:hypothetical protein
MQQKMWLHLTEIMLSRISLNKIKIVLSTTAKLYIKYRIAHFLNKNIKLRLAKNCKNRNPKI